jgi:hypothetical protein
MASVGGSLLAEIHAEIHAGCVPGGMASVGALPVATAAVALVTALAAGAVPGAAVQMAAAEGA